MLEGGAVDDIHAHLAVGPGGLLSEDSCVCLWLVFFFFFFFFTSSHFLKVSYFLKFQSFFFHYP